MQSIKIHIDKLGRVVNSDVIIDRVMLFCGESGMGKSFIAMLCHYFFYVWLHHGRIHLFLKEKDLDYDVLRAQMHNTGTALQINKSDLEEWLAGDALRFLSYLISVELNDAHITVTLPSSVPDVIKFNFEETIEGIVNEEETYVILHSDHLKYRVKDKGINEESPFAVLLRSELMHCIFGSHLALRNYFIFPPSRGAILTEKVTPQSGLYKKFEESLEILRSSDKNDNVEKDQVLAIMSRIMDGKMGLDKEIFFYENDSVHIPLSAAASSVREIGVLQLLLEKTALSNDAILIEEPEAHLHPMKQRMMADLIGGFFNAGAYMQITTHSDYFLHRFNELLMLGKLKEKMNIEQFEAVCREMDEVTDAAISSDGVRAYLLERIDQGNSHIKSLSLEDGIPFTTFREAILLSLKKENKLNELLEHENN